MSIKTSLYTFLSTATTLMAVVSDRVFPEIIPDQVYDAASKRPCLVYSRQGVDRDMTFCGTDSLVKSTMWIDCYARRYADAESLAEIVRGLLTDYHGDMAGTFISAIHLEQDFDLMDLEPGLFRVHLVFGIWHSA